MKKLELLPSKTGEVFTKRWVVNVILDSVGYSSSNDLRAKTIVEPSVGNGNFIKVIIERLLSSLGSDRPKVETIQTCIFGMDIDEDHVKNCRRMVIQKLQLHGYTAEDATFLAKSWIHHGDFLLDPLPETADFVVGNPPYIRYDHVPRERQIRYRKNLKTMTGRGDIYVGFFERGLQLLNDQGALSFICADRWMRNSYGKALRRLVVDGYSMRVVWQMHDVDAFQSAVAAYPAITKIDRSADREVLVIEATKDFDEISVVEVSQFSSKKIDSGEGKGWTGSKLPHWFETDDFWPTGRPKVVQFLEELQERFPRLGDDKKTRIGIGIATGLDKAFVVNKSSLPDIENDRLLPLVSSRDIRDGKLTDHSRYLVNPWSSYGKLVDISKYPKLEKYLDQFPQIRSRHIVKGDSNRWFRTIDKVKVGLCDRPKLVFQDMKAEITPVLEPGGLYPHHNLYYIESESWDLEVLGGLLYSEIANAFIGAYGVRMQSGTMRFQAQYLRRIVVPDPDLIPEDVKFELRDAFRHQNRHQATVAAWRAYDLDMNIGEIFDGR